MKNRLEMLNLLVYLNEINKELIETKDTQIHYRDKHIERLEKQIQHMKDNKGLAKPILRSNHGIAKC